MHRIDSFGTAVSLPTPAAVGATVGYFTNGNAGLSVPATVVDADWLNAVQEELSAVVVGAGLTLDKTNQAQLLAAIQLLIQNNIVATFALANNQSSAANVTPVNNPLVSGSPIYQTVQVDYTIYRKDGSHEVWCKGVGFIVWMPVAAAFTWIDGPMQGDDTHGIVFSVTAAGQMQYTSDNHFTGGSYVGGLRLKLSQFTL